MPITVPTLDDRRYQDLLNEALARISVYTPEWTNFNQSDPGVTLIELFAFLTENLLYRANRIPENNRIKFLTLLGVPLQPASSAQGLITFTNQHGPLRPIITLNNGIEVRAGQVPFRTRRGLDVLPIEAQAYYKHPLADPTGTLKDYYTQLYTAVLGQLPNAQPLLYETLEFSSNASTPIDLGQNTVDGSLWIALLARENDTQNKDNVRNVIAGRTLSLGIVPYLTDASRQLTPAGIADIPASSLLHFRMPNVPATGTTLGLQPPYQTLTSNILTDVLTGPGFVEITLPDAPHLTFWENLGPLQAGTGDFPPALDDTALNDRLITWLRITSPTSVQAQLLWVGINATTVTQRASVFNEQLSLGTGEPDQVATLAKTPVIPASVRITVTLNGTPEEWQETDDLLNAGPEIPTTDKRLPLGTPPDSNPLVKVFTVDAESGRIRFGDGTHGARPPFGALLRANYDYGVGTVGNVGAGAITSGPALPASITVNNPIRTWGGSNAETVSEGEKHIARYLQHRDRLVNATDFETITLRTPGVDIGRVEVLPGYNPALTQSAPGDAPGTVTLMIIPQYDPVHPDAPVADQLFLDTICSYLDERRLVTTEVFLRSPTYKPIWVSVGIQVVPGVSPAQVSQAVKAALTQYLSPLPAQPAAQLDSQVALLSVPQFAQVQRGWPLRKPVIALELLAVASRVTGIQLVNNVQLAEGNNPTTARIPMNGLELPHLVGISVLVGDALSIDQLRGQQAPASTAVYVALPVIPEECR